MIDLPDGYIDDVKHCIGMYGKHKPYKRHGKLFYRPWRNRFNTNIDDPLWSKLCYMGYAEHDSVNTHSQFFGLGTAFFWLTDKGREWFGNLIGVTIHEETD